MNSQNIGDNKPQTTWSDPKAEIQDDEMDPKDPKVNK